MALHRLVLFFMSYLCHNTRYYIYAYEQTDRWTDNRTYDNDNNCLFKVPQGKTNIHGLM